jgi:hypothetical protein
VASPLAVSQKHFHFDLAMFGKTDVSDMGKIGYVFRCGGFFWLY